MVSKYLKRKLYTQYAGLIIADTYGQYRHWLSENGQLSGDWKYIRKPEDALGYHDLPILLVGSQEKIDRRFIRHITGIVQG